jgi:hypothetical protein
LAVTAVWNWEKPKEPHFRAEALVGKSILAPVLAETYRVPPARNRVSVGDFQIVDQLNRVIGRADPVVAQSGRICEKLKGGMLGPLRP